MQAAAAAVWTRKDPVTITTLPYELNGLEPVIPKEIMDYHYGKHHVAYCNNYNNFMPKYHEAMEKHDDELAKSILPKVEFNYGGYWNHDQYWKNLVGVENGGGKTENGPAVVSAIKQEFGTVQNFIDNFNTKTTGIMVSNNFNRIYSKSLYQGSGWGWLVYDKNHKKVGYMALKDQELVEAQGNGQYIGLLTIDIWEHAFYLKWKNLKGEYMKDIWQLINWDEVQKRYKNAISS